MEEDTKENMTFNQALVQIKSGMKVARRGWPDGIYLSEEDLLAKDWVISHELNEPEPGVRGPSRKNEAEDLGKRLGSMLAPLALAGAPLPAIHVNIWKLGND